MYHVAVLRKRNVKAERQGEKMTANEILAEVKNGKRLLVKSYTRPMIIDSKCVNNWEKSGYKLLTDEGNGYRLRTGKNSVYLFPQHIALI